MLAGPHETQWDGRRHHPTQWEWDKAQGFLTLSDDTDALEVDIRAKYTLVLDDDTRCVPTLCHDHNLPLMKYRLQCSPRDLLGQGSNAILYGRSAPRPVYEATGQGRKQSIYRRAITSSLQEVPTYWYWIMLGVISIKSVCSVPSTPNAWRGVISGSSQP